MPVNKVDFFDSKKSLALQESQSCIVFGVVIYVWGECLGGVFEVSVLMF
jgi:hypothetical protein